MIEHAQNTSKLSCGYSAIISYMPPLICICEDILQEQQQQQEDVTKFIIIMTEVAGL